MFEKGVLNKSICISVIYVIQEEDRNVLNQKIRTFCRYKKLCVIV